MKVDSRPTPQPTLQPTDMASSKKDESLRDPLSQASEGVKQAP